jgi:hypothetical protein
MTRISTIVALLVSTSAMAQTAPVKNPTLVVFRCSSDHDLHTGHEMDIVATNGQVIQTLSLGTATPDAAGDVRLPINVQPIAFGVYTARVRAVAGAAKSFDSDPSNVWERAPGRPSQPEMR